MTGYKDGYWWSPDGLRLHYRDYARDAAHPDDGRPPLLCLPGLTRNARDFEPLAQRLAGDWRVICPDMRGRAESAYAKDPMSYVPLTYLQDIGRLLADLAQMKNPFTCPHGRPILLALAHREMDRKFHRIGPH